MGRRRAEQRVDGRTGAVLVRAAPHVDVVGPDEQVAIRRRQIDEPRLEPLAVAGGHDRQWPGGIKNRGQQVRLAVASMDDDEHRDRQVGPNTG
jgi:hypothetical protein